jgi:hypothetical protein
MMTNKPRNEALHKALMECKSGPMEDKSGPRAKRARQKNILRKEIENQFERTRINESF